VPGWPAAARRRGSARRRQRLEYDEQREPDGVGLYRFELRIRYFGVGECRGVLGDGLLGMRPAYPQLVEADPADDRGEPTTEVVDRPGVGAAQPDPGLLYGVLGLLVRPEHPVRDCPQPLPVLLEPLRQPLVVPHSAYPLGSRLSHLRHLLRRGSDVANPRDVTKPEEAPP
jgi:hypothetical protein